MEYSKVNYVSNLCVHFAIINILREVDGNEGNIEIEKETINKINEMFSICGLTTFNQYCKLIDHVKRYYKNPKMQIGISFKEYSKDSRKGLPKLLFLRIMKQNTASYSLEV